MRRREFLHRGLMGSALALAVRNEARADVAATQSSPRVPDFEFEEVSIAALQDALAKGRVTSRALTDQYLARIAAIDKAGPTVGSVIELNPDAREIADALDVERKEKGVRGPLHGIPVLIKDNIDTADRMATTAGSLALVGSKPAADAFVVQRLRQAGAVILGKTNLSEWANFRSTKSTSGWSGRGGQTRNPYALDRSPSGSSSGSGAAAAASFCAAAVGTETNGSIISPASCHGLVGIKPTVGLVSRSGIVPISATQDTAGPMARTVADAAALLGGMAGVDRADAATTRQGRRAHDDYTRFLDPKGLAGARLGVARGMLGSNPHVQKLVAAALDDLERLGATLVDVTELKDSEALWKAEIDLLLYEFKDGLDKYFAALGPDAPVRSLADVIAFNEKNHEKELRYFGQERMLQAQKKGPLTSPEYVAARRTCRQLSRTVGIDAALATHKLDALVALANDPAWVIDPVNGDNFGAAGYAMAAIAGYPSLTVPMGDVFGLPVGLLFFAAAWGEPTLIKFGYAYEQATKHRRAPTFAPTASLGVSP